MLTREERFYDVVAQEIAEGAMLQGTWAKAFSIAVGDEQKARALYIKLRVDQQEKEYQQAIAGLLQEYQVEITTGKLFVCPHCQARTTAKSERVETIFSWAPVYRYRCRACDIELRFDAPPMPTKTTKSPDLNPLTSPATESPGAAKRNNAMALTGFVLGLVSVVFFFIGLIPILAALFSGIGLATFKPEGQKNKWMAGVGLALGAVYTIVYLNHYGHLK